MFYYPVSGLLDRIFWISLVIPSFLGRLCIANKQASRLGGESCLFTKLNRNVARTDTRKDKAMSSMGAAQGKRRALYRFSFAFLFLDI